MKITIINGAHRNNGATSLLVNKFKEEISSSANVIIYNLCELNIGYQNSENKYNSNDDFQKIKEDMLSSSIIIFASPIYWYAMSGRLKTFMDRFSEILYSTDKEKLIGLKIGLLFTYGSKDYDECFIKPIELTSKYMEMDYRGSFGIQSTYSPIGFRNPEELKNLDVFIKNIFK